MTGERRLERWVNVQVRVTVPEIAVSMDAQEFQILQDVAAHLAAEQVRLRQCLAYASHVPHKTFPYLQGVQEKRASPGTTAGSDEQGCMQ